MVKRISFLILLLTISFSISAQQIRKIEFVGLKTTSKKWLSTQLLCKPKAKFDKEVFDRDIQYLKDLNMFFGVSGKFILEEDKVDLIINFKESMHFYPIFGYESDGNKYKIKGGGSYDNFLGMKGKIGGFVEFYDRLSYIFYHELPLHLNNKTGHFFSTGYRSTIEPVHQGDASHEVDFTLFTIGGGGYYHWKPKLTSSLGFQYFKETYRTSYSNSPLFNEGKGYDFNKLQLVTGLKHDKIHYVDELLLGTYWKIEGEYIKTFEFDNEFGNFFKFTTTTKYFTKLFNNHKDNLAIRFQLGLASNGDTPIPPFYVDNFTNVRGSGDRIARGTAQWVLNFEYRYTILTHPWFYMQSVAYTDLSGLRPITANSKSLVKKENLYYASGLGLRIQLRKLYHIVLRLDYSLPIYKDQGNGIVFGVGHYF